MVVMVVVVVAMMMGCKGGSLRGDQRLISIRNVCLVSSLELVVGL